MSQWMNEATKGGKQEEKEGRKKWMNEWMNEGSK